jgi:hypothetical protein
MAINNIRRLRRFSQIVPSRGERNILIYSGSLRQCMVNWDIGETVHGQVHISHAKAQSRQVIFFDRIYRINKIYINHRVTEVTENGSAGSFAPVLSLRPVPSRNETIFLRGPDPFDNGSLLGPWPIQNTMKHVHYNEMRKKRELREMVYQHPGTMT